MKKIGRVYALGSQKNLLFLTSKISDKIAQN